VFEDVTNSGVSSIKAIETLRNNSLEVTDIISVVDYSFGAEKALESISVKLHSMVKRDNFLVYGVVSGKTDSLCVGNYKDYLNNPLEWNFKNGFSLD